MIYDSNASTFYVERFVYATGVVHSLWRVHCFIVMRASVRAYSFERVEHTIKSEISPLWLLVFSHCTVFSEGGLGRG